MVELLRENKKREMSQLEQETPAFEAKELAPQNASNSETSPRAHEVSNRQIAIPTTETPVPDNSTLKTLEDALAQDLVTVYQALPADKQALFREKGEELARDVQRMIANNSWKGHRVLQRVTAWLNLIPNVNVYYLRQMAKIKYDALADIREAQQ